MAYFAALFVYASVIQGSFVEVDVMSISFSIMSAPRDEPPPPPARYCARIAGDAAWSGRLRDHDDADAMMRHYLSSATSGIKRRDDLFIMPIRLRA